MLTVEQLLLPTDIFKQEPKYSVVTEQTVNIFSYLTQHDKGVKYTTFR